MIKMEPHTPEKIAVNRQRLISILSLVDQMVDRILFHAMFEMDKETAMSRAGKTGWTPMPHGFNDLLESFPDSVLATDCSAFDWTFPEWLPEMITQARLEQFESYSPEFERAFKRRIAEVLGPRCTLRLPNGRRYRQQRYGIMKSGWLGTISVNSDAQDMITSLAWKRAFPESGQPPLLWSMGDDVIMRWNDKFDSTALVSEIRRLGILSKFAVQSREFSGFNIYRSPQGPVVNPLYPNKHRYQLAHVPVEQLEEVLTSYGLVYALSDQREWIEPYVRQYSRITRSVELAWAHGLLGGAQMVSTGDAGGNFSWD